MKSHRVGDGERILAVFIDFENLALGFGNRRDRFNIEKVLERLVEKGKIVAKKAYADWSRFGFFTSELHESAVELIEIPKRVMTGKNSADIRMCVDAMDLAYSKDHIDTFVVVSGDSDFSPLVSKLKELGKHVIGLGLADSTSNLLRDNCDEFIYYEDLDRAPITPLAENVAIPETKRKAFALMLDSLLALRRENKEVIFSSMVKDTMKRKKPSFNEEYHGYRTFSELLEDAQRFGILELERHKNSGTYVVTRFESEPKTGTGSGVLAPAARVPLALPGPVKPAVVAPAPRPPLAITPPTRPVAPPPAPPAKTPAANGSRERPAVEPRGTRPAARPAARQPEPLASEPPPPPRKVVTLPSRPIPVPVPPPVEVEEEDDEDRVPLGRALIDELDEDDFDDIPSYMSRKPAPASSTKIPPVVGTKPAPKQAPVKPASAKPAASPARGAKPAKAPAASGERAKTPRKTAAGEPPAKAAKPIRAQEPKPQRKPAAAPAEPAPAPLPPPPARTPVAPKPAPKPVPKPVSDDEFGAGLDL
ncbi:NYN domain-containing protein [Fimbriiglobus ruber]|uniref:Maebl n=1 Tax=Fimbriiglobus ruber TaxID=1908690 RepID=A0A225DW86_9BACT|nr:NYN domain-containing protein [Fimbriiglobus ruber]OWK45651.1 Maebl [Fimbriiglobus ruber]